MSWDQLVQNAGWVNDNINQFLPSGQALRMLGRLHLAMPYSDGAQQDATAPVNSLDPNNHSLNYWETVLGITPEMKARDLQNDRAAFYRTPEGEALKRKADLSGFKTMTDNGTQRNIRTITSELSRATPNIEALEREGVTYSQLGLANAGNVKDKDGNLKRVSASEILQRATAYNALKQVQSELTKEGAVPKPGATLAELNTQLRNVKDKNAAHNSNVAETIRYGTLNPDGSRTGGTVAGRQELAEGQGRIEANKESIEASKSTRRVNEGTLEINRVTAQNNIAQAKADNDWREYLYEDKKVTDAANRQWEAGREDARYAARAKEIQMQNDADMARYELMLKNDREVRRSEDIGDLFGALALLGGAFMI